MYKTNIIQKASIFFLGSHLIMISVCYSQEDQPRFFTADDLASVVVYLVQEKVEIVEKNNEYFELWLKKPDGKNPDSSNCYPKTSLNTGTGFFLAVNTDMYLVTASHVAQHLTTSSYAILRGTNDEPVRLNLTDIIGAAELDWKISAEADVAVHKLRPSNGILTYLKKRFLPSYLLVDSLYAPTRDTPLTIVGFPLGLGIDGYFSPLTLQTRSSSGLIRLPRFDNSVLSTFFICEDPSIGGYSGAPCFDTSIYKLGGMTTTGDGTKLYGLIHGTISDRTGGKLTAVTPIRYVLDLVE